MIKIIDNFLDEKDFTELDNHINLPGLCWTHSRKANHFSKDDNAFQFFHVMIKDWVAKYDDSEKLPSMVVKNYLKTIKKDKINVVKIVHAKANLFVRTTNKPVEMGHHKDIDKPGYHTILLYLQDSNGHTQFKKTKENVYSKRNRALIFPTHLEHQTVSATDVLFRTNLNINFTFTEEEEVK
tara:strand:- start:817 stop:1362 length:546 start_codon:yes stop_codon:yes gene_type:complete